jgi:hypothetical protein
MGGRVTGTIESDCRGNFQLESKSDKTQAKRAMAFRAERTR